MTSRPAGSVTVLSVVLALAACGKDPFGAPPRVATHGFRAHVTIKQAGTTTEFEVAARGADRRREPPAGVRGPITIWKTAEKKVYELDPAAKTYAERAMAAEDEVLPGFPLAPGFSEEGERARRGVLEYRRESDTVFAGHACWLVRFEERPGEPGSPSTTYWVARDLDNLVVRVDRETPRADGTAEVAVTQLTNVRVGAQPELFELPKGVSRR